MAKAAFSLLIILWFASYGQSRFISETDSDLVSDGIPHVHQPSVLHLGRPSSSTDTCDQTYGFLPCTTTVLGNIFLMLAYGYLMLVGAKCLSSGSELLLNILGPGIIGGLFLPVLGALPDALLILGKKNFSLLSVVVAFRFSCINLTASFLSLYLTFRFPQNSP